YCLHRIVTIKNDEITLRGDGIYKYYETATLSEVIGVLHSVTRQSGRVVICNSATWIIWSYIWKFLFPLRKYLLYIHFNMVLQSSSKSI
ncbi:MAG: hypothetical protein RR206_05065, partial [Bacteroidaceae bacterium]